MNEDNSWIDLESFDCPHIFVPGNHDHPSVYTNEEPRLLSSLEEKSTNLHNRCVKIADHLWMVGFGGSIPRYHLDGSISKPGYPYESTDMEKDSILKILDLIPEEDYVILLTHCPPDNVGSGVMYKDKYANQVFKLGSPSMCHQIFEAQRTVCYRILAYYPLASSIPEYPWTCSSQSWNELVSQHRGRLLHCKSWKYIVILSLSNHFIEVENMQG